MKLSSYDLKANLASFSLQVPGIVELGLKPRKIQKVAVIGGGLMGSGIVTALILSGYSVLLKEVNDKFLQMGLGRVRGNFSFIIGTRASQSCEYVARSCVLHYRSFDRMPMLEVARNLFNAFL